MVNLKSWKVLAVFFEIFWGISASTHWVVTENGRIQPQLDSVFHLHRPYDLLALLEQEQRIRAIEELNQELVLRKRTIDLQWSDLESAADLESQLYSQDPDCVKAGHNFADIDLDISLIGDIRDRIELDLYLVSGEGGVPELPDCTAGVDLDFSMPNFEHLQVMVKRANLSTSPELSLASIILGNQDMAHFAHQVALGLQRNSTSWLHHNLAAVYWRIRGNAPNAVECARRAVHFAPRQYRDVALVTLGGLLQKAKAIVEAALVLHAAVDHAPFAPQNHLALGTVYAILGDYNRSVACLDNALRLRPGLDTAAKLKHAVKCHHKLENGLLDLHQSLQSLLTDLQEYHTRQEHWLQLQENLRREQAPLELRLLNQDPGLVSLFRGSDCVEYPYESGQTALRCDKSHFSTFQLQAQSLQVLLRKVESRAKKINEQMIRHSATSKKRAEFDLIRSSGQEHHASSTVLADKSNSKEHETWPTHEECSAFSNQFPSVKDLSSVFLAPEDRGFEAHLYLSRLIGLNPGEEHALPWHPPTCSLGDVHHDPAVQHLFPRGVTPNAENAAETELLPLLLKYGLQDQPVEAEIGQRILSAINKDVGPRWLLHSLAALYWRVKGNVQHTMDCLKVAVASAPTRFRDVPLVSLGALLLRSSQLKAARQAAVEALEADDSQVTTHFLLGLISEAQGNHSGAVYHLKIVVDKQPDYLGNRAKDLLRAAACREKYSTTLHTEDYLSEETCGTGKPMDLLSGLEGTREGDIVVCSIGGQQCHLLQCLSPGDCVTGDVVTLGPATMAQLLGPGSSQYMGDDGMELPDETELERMGDSNILSKHHRLSLVEGNERDSQSSNLADFYVPVALMDSALLRVYDKSGIYALSPAECERINGVDWAQDAAVWLSSSGGDILVSGLLPLPSEMPSEVNQPLCDGSLPPSPNTLDHLEGVRLRHHLRASAETGLQAWLAAALGDPAGSLRQIGARLAQALQENATSWILATAAALYWRVRGQADEAVTCLRQALLYAPEPQRIIPLVSLASVLSRAGFYGDAVVVINMALDIDPRFFVAHFTLANIHASMGDMEKAITFYRSSLELEPTFEPARNRLLAILCSVLFEEHRKPDSM